MEEGLHPRRRVVITGEVGTLASDARRMAKMGYRPVVLHPVDVGRQGFGVEIISSWKK